MKKYAICVLIISGCFAFNACTTADPDYSKNAYPGNPVPSVKEKAVALPVSKNELPSKKKEKEAPIRFREALLVEQFRIKLYPSTIRNRKR